MNEKDKQIKSYSEADIRDYLEGKLSPAQMHALEKAAMDDPFLADAIEGIGLSREEGSASFGSATDDLKKRLAERIRKEEKNRVLPFIVRWRVAASVVLIAGAGISSYFLLIRKPETKPDMSLVREKDLPADELSRKDHPASSEAKVDTVSRADLSKISAAGADTVSVAFNDKSSPPRRVLRKEESAPSYPAKVTPGAEPLSPAITEPKEISAFVPAEKDKTATRPAPETALQGKVSGVAVRGAASFNNRQQSPNPSREKEKQSPFIEGVVTDSNAVPVSNATVVLEHTGEAVTTDPNGRFRIRTDLPDSSQDIRVNAIGYQPVSVSIDPSKTNDRLIRLFPVSDALAEVVVVGYGGRKKESSEVEENSVPERRSSNAQRAEPVVGWPAYNDYIRKNKKINSADSVLKGIEIVSFLVDKKGNLSSFRIEKSVSPQHDAAVIRLIREGPPWKLIKGKRYRCRLSVDFD
jgi:hypothetical protein